VKVLRVAILTATSLGVAPEAALRVIGVSPEGLSDPATRVPHELAARAWTEIPLLARAEDFGLRAAELVTGAPFDVVDHTLRSSATMRAAVELLMRYQRLLHDANDVRLEASAHGEVRLSQRLAGGLRMPDQLADFVTAQWVLRGAALAGEPAAIRRVSLMRPIPPDLGTHRRLFPCPIAFGEAFNAIWFGAGFLDKPVTSADASLSPVLTRHADDLLAALPPSANVGSRLRAMLAGTLPRGVPDLPAAAKALGVSSRSLQRHLDGEGTSFKALLDDVRRELAIGYLRDGTRTISEVAFMVGFAEVSAFSRAFRRWTGKSAKTWRAAEPRASISEPSSDCRFR
jgi:AraC-like DNA-binding protein